MTKVGEDRNLVKAVCSFVAIFLFSLLLVAMVGKAANGERNITIIPHEDGDVIVHENYTAIHNPDSRCTLYTRMGKNGLESKMTCYRGRPNVIVARVETPEHVAQIWAER